MALSRWSKRIKWRWFRKAHRVHYGLNGYWCDICDSGYSYDAPFSTAKLEWIAFHMKSLQVF